MSDQPSERARRLCDTLAALRSDDGRHPRRCAMCAAIQAALDEEREEGRRQVEVEGIVAHCVNLEGAEPPRHDCWCVVCNAVRKEREACAMMHESINTTCDHERLEGHPGAGAMGAVIEYRDAIRSRSRA